MALIRNAALALLATALLIGGLVVLFPTPAEAAQVHLTSAGITPPTSASGNPFDVKFTVKIPAGEHIPADFAKVLVASSSATLGAGGTLNAPYICDARTSGSPGAATAAIISISGAAAASTSYFGYGYEVTASGSGYSFANPTVVFNSGSGSGYGGGTAGEKTITVTVRVSNCAITYTSGQATVKMQAFIGSSTTQLRSFPVTVTLFDPAAPAPTNPTTSNGDIVITVTQSSSGGLTSTDILIDTSGGFDGVAGGVTITVTPPAGSGFSEITLVTKAGTTLPDGSRLVLTFNSAATGGTPSLTLPPFNIQTAALSAQTAKTPALFFQVKLYVPGSGDVPTGNFFSSLTIKFDLDNSYFTGVSSAASQFVLRGFTDAGGLKGGHPAKLSLTTAGSTHSYTFRITLFSSFAGVIPKVVSGGGGGGGGGPVPTTTDSVTTTTTTTTPTTTTAPPPPPVLDKDGDGVPDSVEIALGTDPDDATSTPTFRMSGVTAVRRGDTVTLNWGDPPAAATGFQVWRSTSPWVLLATLVPESRTYTDFNAPPGAVYQVTYYISQDPGHGYVRPSQDPGTVLADFPAPGTGVVPTIEDPGTQTSTETSSGSSIKTGVWWSITALVVVVAAAIAVGVAILIKRKEHGP
jgi:hypothetical protein